MGLCLSHFRQAGPTATWGRGWWVDEEGVMKRDREKGERGWRGGEDAERGMWSLRDRIQCSSNGGCSRTLMLCWGRERIWLLLTVLKRFVTTQSMKLGLYQTFQCFSHPIYNGIVCFLWYDVLKRTPLWYRVKCQHQQKNRGRGGWHFYRVILPVDSPHRSSAMLNCVVTGIRWGHGWRGGAVQASNFSQVAASLKGLVCNQSAAFL